MEEKSFGHLYKNSTSFNIEVDGDNVIVRLNKFYNSNRPSEGLVFDTESVFENNSKGFQKLMIYLEQEMRKTV